MRSSDSLSEWEIRALANSQEEEGSRIYAEPVAISYIRNHYMDTPMLAAAFLVVVGGLLVFLSGILIGSA